MKKGILSAIGIIAEVFLFFVLTEENHHTNLNYLLWKHGLSSDWENGLKYFNVDVNFRLSFNGKSRSDLLLYFPNLKPLSQPPPSAIPILKEYEASQGEWIGESNWLVIYDHRIIKSIRLVKG